VLAGDDRATGRRRSLTTARRVLAWVMLVACLLGWPVAALTFARGEPPVVLALSFLALAYEAFNAVQIAHDKEDA
jgi:hypothetical protein